MYRILVAEDEKTERDSLVFMIEKIFNNKFCEIVIACNGVDAVEKVMLLHPDILLVDIQMPGKNGLEVLKEVSPDFPEMECAIITAYGYFEYAREAVSLGVREYLLKPLACSEFERALNKMLSNLEMKRKIKSLLDGITGKTFLYQYSKNPGGCYESVNKCTDGYRENCSFFKDFSNLSLGGMTGEASGALINRIKGQFDRCDDPSFSIKRIVNFLIIYYRSFDLPECDFYKSLNIELLESAIDDFEQENKLAILINDFLINVNSIIEDVKKTEKSDILVNDIEKIIIENYSSDINLEKISRIIKKNPAYISRLYKKKTGINIREKITAVRISKACELLSTGKCSVKKAAYETGFHDPNYFSTVFKKETGFLASDYLLFHSKKL